MLNRSALVTTAARKLEKTRLARGVVVKMFKGMTGFLARHSTQMRRGARMEKTTRDAMTKGWDPMVRYIY
jgi:hypothetical protein